VHVCLSIILLNMTWVTAAWVGRRCATKSGKARRISQGQLASWYFLTMDIFGFSKWSPCTPRLFLKESNVNLYSALSCCTSKALRYSSCVTRGSHSFTCHPHTNHTCLYSPAARRHRPLASTNLYCLVNRGT